MLLIWTVRYYLLDDWSAPTVGVDFAVFWSAARVTIEDGAVAAFSPQWMEPLESAIWHQLRFSPWPYPPTFLLAVLPLGWLTFNHALAMYSLLGVLSYAAVLACFARGVSPASRPMLLAFPGVAVTLGMGQNALFTVAVAGGALLLQEFDSVWAGLCVALLVIKPQLGILFPLALILGRRWKSFVAAALCSASFIGASTYFLGRDAWLAFASFLPEFNRVVVENGGAQMWTGMPSIFALCRGVGLSMSGAYLVHCVFAAFAVAVMIWLWAERGRFELRAASLVLATLAIQPYSMFYDLVWMVLPIALLMRDARVAPINRAEWVVLAGAWLSPAIGFLANHVQVYFPIAPVALIAMLVMVARRHLRHRATVGDAAGAVSSSATSGEG
jgi:hypothetical protein